MFVTNEVRWNLPSVVPPAAIAAKLSLTDIAREAMRSSPVCDPDHAFFHLAPGWLLGATKSRYAVFLQMAPYLPTSVMDKVLGWKLWRLQLPAQKKRRLKQESEALALTALPATIPSPSDKPAWGRWQMTELGRWMRMGAPEGGIATEQFDELTKLMDVACATHLQVFVIDLPLPSWHRAESAYFAPYQSSMREVMAPYISSGRAKLITIVDKIPDDEFQDCGHPTPTVLNIGAISC